MFDKNDEITFIGENFFDIENLVKFYSMFYVYEMNELKNDLQNIETNEEKKNIVNVINNFIFSLIEKTMTKLKEISETPQINDNKLRETILNYSIAIVYKYSENVHRQLKENKEEIKLLNNNLNLIKQKCSLVEKVNDEQLNNKIIEQTNTETELNGGSIGITELANELEKLDTENDIENTNTLSEILNYMFSKKNKSKKQ
jgi:RNA polymerase-interacting CarD/CdnL/TRCF family regulator